MSKKTNAINFLVLTSMVAVVMGCGREATNVSVVQNEQPASVNEAKASPEYSLYAPTIQLNAQRAAIEEICRWADTNDTSVGCAVIVDETGNVIAIADCGGTNDEPRPFAVHRKIEPGHLLSPFTAAVAINSRAIRSIESEFTSDRAESAFSEYRLPWDGSDEISVLSVSNALVRSSNTVMSKIGLLCGRHELYDGFSRLGLVSSVKVPNRWSMQERARIPIGQGIRMNALDLARAYAILANSGCSTNGEQVISAETAASILSALEGVVQSGTGCNAAVYHVRIAGKTSTSVRMSKNGCYESGKYISAFASIFPAEKPKYAMVVWFETARNEKEPRLHFGGGRAALASRAIIKRIISLYGDE